MNTRNSLFFLIASAIMTSCSDTVKITNTGTDKNNYETDTIRVTGVFAQPTAYFTTKKKYLRAVNKKGQEYDMLYDTNSMDSNDGMVMFVERGDTLVIQNNKIVKNLTQERIKSEFVNGR